jgi:hypothetical protein
MELKRSNSFQKLRATIKNNSVKFVQKLKGDIDHRLNNLTLSNAGSSYTEANCEQVSVQKNESKPKIINSASLLDNLGSAR